MTDAINILISALCKQPPNIGSAMSQKPVAIWHIFPTRSCEGLREYLKGKTGDDTGDPIHNQETYLTAEMLKDLEGLGIVPWEIEQREGDIVYIPAGCPHQVSSYPFFLTVTDANLQIGSQSWIYSQGC